jgi:hypothetical protein
MKLSESIKPADYCPITRSDYNHAVTAAGALMRQGFPDLAERVEDAAKEIRRRLVGGGA